MEMDRQELIEKYGEPTSVKNGIVLQLHKDVSKLKVTSNTAAFWLLTWVGDESTDPRVLNAKIHRTVKKASTLRRKSLEDFKEAEFTFPKHPSPADSDSTAPSTSSDPSTHDVELAKKQREIQDLKMKLQLISSDSSSRPTNLKIKKFDKKLNEKIHEIAKKERQIGFLQKRVQGLKDKAQRIGHWSVKSIQKREKKSDKMTKTLRLEKKRFATLARKLEQENELLRKELRDVNARNVELEVVVSCQRAALEKYEQGEKDCGEFYSKSITFEKMCKEEVLEPVSEASEKMCKEEVLEPVSEASEKMCKEEVLEPVFEASEKMCKEEVLEPVFEASEKMCKEEVLEPVFEASEKMCKEEVLEPVSEASEKMCKEEVLEPVSEASEKMCKEEVLEPVSEEMEVGGDEQD